MIEINGKFTMSGYVRGVNTVLPASGAYLELVLRHDDYEDARLQLVEEGGKFRIVDDRVFDAGEEVELHDLHYSFVLGRGGEIPPGACVRGNDEILPPGNYYSLVVEDPNQRYQSTYYSNERIEITAPVDLTPPPEPEPKVDPDALLSPWERALKYGIVRDGSVRVSKKNRIGFFAGIHCPTSNAGSVTLPSRENGEFGVFPFTLPFPAVVNSVSILVDTAGKGAVTIGIYDAGGTKRGDAAIDLRYAGLAGGSFRDKVDLSEGDYFLAWATDTVCGAQLRGIGVVDQLNLLNANGAAVMGTGRSQRGATLPDTLGAIIPNDPHPEYRPNSIYGPTYAPILAYFKA